MVATVYSDASYLPEDNIGAYAYWIKTHKGDKKLARLCPPDKVFDIGMAEAYGLYQAVGHTLHHFPNTTHINLFSDSQYAIKLLDAVVCKVQGKTGKDALLRRLHKGWRVLVGSVEVTLQYRSDKGAANGNGGFAMGWCDTQARATTLAEVKRRSQLPGRVRGPGVGVKGMHQVG